MLCAVVLLLFSLPGCTRTIQSEKPVENGPVYEEVLSNGLKVFIIHDRNAPLAVFQIWYDAGSVHEQIGKTGLSHLLEHMMFKGTPAHGPKTFSKIIKRAGGIDNAGTSKDFVYYLSPNIFSSSRWWRGFSSSSNSTTSASVSFNKAWISSIFPEPTKVFG